MMTILRVGCFPGVPYAQAPRLGPAATKLSANPRGTDP